MNKPMYLLFVLALTAGCGALTKADQDFNPDVPRESCGDYVQCLDDDSTLTTQYAYLESSERLAIRLQVEPMTLDSINRVIFEIDADAQTGTVYNLNAREPMIDAVMWHNLTMIDPDLRRKTLKPFGRVIIDERTENSVTIRIRDLSFRFDEQRIFLMKDATITIDCIGEYDNSAGCGGLEPDQCGVPRIEVGQCDG